MKTKVLLMAFFGMISSVFANNINVTNATITNRDTSTHTAKINFDVSWENSWRTTTNENNYDGAWIFVKYQINGTGAWRHCTLKTSGFTADGDSEIKVAPIETDNTRGKGAFIYRNVTSIGIGNISFTGNQLVWDYAIDGVLDNATVQIKVFAIEMVYIPTGNYYLGSGGQEVNCFKNGNTTNPYYVNNPSVANPITIGTASGQLNFNGSGTITTNPPIIPATFPNGYNAFWIMKYECTRQQYADFLNCLTLSEATVLNSGTTAEFPGTLPFIGTNGKPFWPAPTTTSAKAMALADWSALRPMSELEYEKACRGKEILPVANEYVWGNNTLISPITIDFSGESNETVVSPANANAMVNLSAINNPVRVGIFARANSSRQNSGGTYYGVMNMGDNFYETVINSGTEQGRAISSTTHGDGSLNPNGNGQTDIPTWLPTTAFGIRGTAWNGAANLARTSDRDAIGSFGSYDSRGMRMVRTAP
jgi:hypothetical protein